MNEKIKTYDGPSRESIRTPMQAARAAIAKRRVFEYTTLSSEQPLRAAQLDTYGADGWELVSLYVRFDAVYAVFKREVV